MKTLLIEHAYTEGTDHEIDAMRAVVTVKDEDIYLAQYAGGWGIKCPSCAPDNPYDLTDEEVHALWRCESPEKAVALAKFLDENGDDIDVGEPPFTDPGCDESGPASQAWNKWCDERCDLIGTPDLIFRNGEPRGPKGVK